MIKQELEVDIMPKGKERPRFYGGHAYTAPAQFEHEHQIRKAWMDKYGMEPVATDCPVAVIVSFSKPLPKSVKQPRPWIQVPDIDNLAKSVLDALNGVAFVDDKQIVRLQAVKQSQRPESVAGISITVVHFDGSDEWEVSERG